MTALQDAESTAALQSGFGDTTLTISDLWVAALGVGGEMRRKDVADIASGRRPATATEHDILATALNDWFVDNAGDHPVLLWAGLPSVD